MSRRANRRNRKLNGMIHGGNGKVFREQVALIPPQEVNRLCALGQGAFKLEEMELIGNTAVAVAKQTGRHPTLVAGLIAAGVVADMVISAIRSEIPEPKPGEELPPLVKRLVEGLAAGRNATKTEADERCGKPIEDGEDLVMRAKRSGLVIAH